MAAQTSSVCVLPRLKPPRIGFHVTRPWLTHCLEPLKALCDIQPQSP